MSNPYQPPASSPEDESATEQFNEAGVHYHGALTVEEVYAGARLAVPRWRSVIQYVALALLSVIALFLIVVASSAYYHQDLNTLRITMIGVGIPVGIIALKYGLQWYRRQALVGMALRDEGLFAETTGYVGPEGVQSQSAVASTKLKWKAFSSYRESKSAVIVYQRSPLQYLIFGRGKFQSEEDWRRFISIVNDHLPRAG